MATPLSASITLAIDSGRTPPPLSTGEKDADLWRENYSICYCFYSTMALLTGDQGHFIMGCPAATLLSTGLSDEGECSQLW